MFEDICRQFFYNYFFVCFIIIGVFASVISFVISIAIDIANIVLMFLFPIFSTCSFVSIFKFLALGLSIMVVNTRNPIHAVLFLILVFINSAIVFLFLKAEFFALSLIIVYVGAIAVLFLFVVMVLDIRIIDFKRGYMLYYPPGIIATIVVAILSKLFFIRPFEINYIQYLNDLNFFTQSMSLSNLNVLGVAIFNYYFFFLFLSSVILLVAIVGAVVLTLELPINFSRKLSYTTLSDSRIFFKKSK